MTDIYRDVFGVVRSESRSASVEDREIAKNELNQYFEQRKAYEREQLELKRQGKFPLVDQRRKEERKPSVLEIFAVS